MKKTCKELQRIFRTAVRYVIISCGILYKGGFTFRMKKVLAILLVFTLLLAQTSAFAEGISKAGYPVTKEPVTLRVLTGTGALTPQDINTMTIYGILEAVEKHSQSPLQFDPQSDAARVEKLLEGLKEEALQSPINQRIIDLIEENEA